MQSFTEWMGHGDDGPPLEPHTISAAENQIRILARNIRTTFNHDPNFVRFRDVLLKATNLMDDAAGIIGHAAMQDQDTLDLRVKPHKYHRPS